MSQKEGNKSTVRIDYNLLKNIQKWIKENGNKYQYPSISSFVNSAIYEKLKRLKGENNT